MGLFYIISGSGSKGVSLAVLSFPHGKSLKAVPPDVPMSPPSCCGGDGEQNQNDGSCCLHLSFLG